MQHPWLSLGYPDCWLPAAGRWLSHALTRVDAGGLGGKTRSRMTAASTSAAQCALRSNVAPSCALAKYNISWKRSSVTYVAASGSPGEESDNADMVGQGSEQCWWVFYRALERLLQRKGRAVCCGDTDRMRRDLLQDCRRAKLLDHLERDRATGWALSEEFDRGPEARKVQRQ
jgi:hypothetical protein